MYLPLCWLLFFVVVGAFVFGSKPFEVFYPAPEANWNQQTPSDECALIWKNFRRGFVYSLDMFLPLIRLNEKNYDVKMTGSRQGYLYLHKLLGWLLSAYVVAAVTGLTKSGVGT